MSGEAQLNISFTITKNDAAGILNYRSYPTAFIADVALAIGPTPGALLVSTVGTDVSFAQLTTPGLCKLTNQDATNFVEYGIHDPVTNKFYFLGELLPGEFYILRLSRWLGREETEPGVGTGTSLGSANKLCMRSNHAPCVVLVEAFNA
jgi:hypothetical protein